MSDTRLQGLRQAFKDRLPTGLTRTVGRSVRYGRRLSAWLEASRYVKGRTAKDAAIIRRSLLNAPREMLADLDQWREPALIADAEVSIRGVGTFKIRGQSDDLGHVLPSANLPIIKTIRERLKPGDFAIDAGANIGATAVPMAQCVGATGHVLAVEMMPDTAACLRHNLALNDLSQVTVVEQALSDIAGNPVTATVTEGIFGQATIAATENSGANTRDISVVTTTLDELTRNRETIALMKMDLEGAEPQALVGATEMLSRTQAIIFESWAEEGGETSRILESAGFTISTIDGRNFLAERT